MQLSILLYYLVIINQFTELKLWMSGKMEL